MVYFTFKILLWLAILWLTAYIFMSANGHSTTYLL